MTDKTPRRLSESSRVEAFSDGVFSIAITLLVLELAVPAVRDRFAVDLREEWVSYIAYLAAFANIGVLWMGHHTVFTRIVAVDFGVAVAEPRTAAHGIGRAVPDRGDRQRLSGRVVRRPVGGGRGLRRRRGRLGRRVAAPLQLPGKAPASRRPADRSRTSSGSRSRCITLVGYAVAAVIGWFLPSVALAIFLVFPALYVIRVRSAA